MQRPLVNMRTRERAAESVITCCIGSMKVVGIILVFAGIIMLLHPGGGNTYTLVPGAGGGGASSGGGSGSTPSPGGPPNIPIPTGPEPGRSSPDISCQRTTIPPFQKRTDLADGTTEMIIVNNEFSDGVVFCRGPVENSMNRVFLDKGLTQTVVKSEFDCSVPGSKSATMYGEGVPGGTTLAFGLCKGGSVSLYVAPDGGWPSGACWYQDLESNKRVSIAKGPQYMSEVEFTIEASGRGAVWYDMSSVEGVSGGITMNYTDDTGKTQHDVAVPGRFQGDRLKVVPAPGIGFPTVLSDKNTLGSCTCNVWDKDSAECNSDACYAGCPGSLVDNPCGQHRCRKFYAQLYQDPTSYCGWLYQAQAQTYCWAMDEWQCVDQNCGYGGNNQPAADCSTELPDGAAANTYSCGHGSNLPAREPGQFFWTDGPGCKDKMVVGVPTNPAPPRFGGRILISFENLPWLHE